MRISRLLLPLILALWVVLLMNVSLARAGVPVDVALPGSSVGQSSTEQQDNLSANLVRHWQRVLAAPTPVPTSAFKSVPTSTLTSTPIISVDVPILVYHTVGHGSRSTNVTTQTFAAQMDWLQQNGYTTVSLDQVAAALRGQDTLPPKPVALTFDDGWASDITNVVPVLQSHGLRATFFIVARYGGWHSPAYLTWDQIKAIRNAGMWIGSHSFSHTNLNKLNAAGLRYEVADSKVEIEKHISGSVTVFDYPYGAYSPRVVKAVQYAGYVAAVVISPMIRQRSDQIYRLNRITMSNAVTMERFKFYMSGGKIAPLLSPRRSSLWNPGRACHHHPC